MFEFLGVSIRRRDGWRLILLALLASVMLAYADLLDARLGPLGSLISIAVSTFLLVVFVIVGMKVGRASRNVGT